VASSSLSPLDGWMIGFRVQLEDFLQAGILERQY
jgi:hypothetical protein